MRQVFVVVQTGTQVCDILEARHQCVKISSKSSFKVNELNVDERQNFNVVNSRM